MTTGDLVIRPMQWSALPPLHDAAPLDASDMACMEEVRAVLARHGKLHRFAMHLAHSHFELAPGEVLIEWPDAATRTQHVTVGRLEDEPDARPTTWLFDDAPVQTMAGNAVYCVCVVRSPLTDACSGHGKSSDPGRAFHDAEQAKQKRIAEEKARLEQGGPIAGHDRDGREQ